MGLCSADAEVAPLISLKHKWQRKRVFLFLGIFSVKSDLNDI